MARFKRTLSPLKLTTNAQAFRPGKRMYRARARAAIRKSIPIGYCAARSRWRALLPRHKLRA